MTWASVFPNFFQVYFFADHWNVVEIIFRRHIKAFLRNIKFVHWKILHSSDSLRTIKRTLNGPLRVGESTKVEKHDILFVLLVAIDSSTDLGSISTNFMRQEKRCQIVAFGEKSNFHVCQQCMFAGDHHLIHS